MKVGPQSHDFDLPVLRFLPGILIVSLICIAPSTPATAQAGSPDLDEPYWVLLVNDGETDFAIKLSDPRAGTMFIHAAGMAKYGPLNKDYDAAAPVADAIQVSGSRGAGVVKIRLDAVITKWNPSASRPRAFDGESRNVLVGTYSLAPGSGPLKVNDGQQYHVPALRFTLVHVALDACAASEQDIPNLTSSVKVENLGSRAEEGKCTLLLRNVAEKTVAHIVLGRLGNDGRTLEQQLSGRVSIPPGATEPIAAYVGNVSGIRNMTIAACLFADGTFEGDERLAMQVLSNEAGRALAIERFAGTLQELLCRDDDAKLLSALQIQVNNLRDSDAAVEEKVLAKINPHDPEEMRKYIREGVTAANRIIRARFDACEKTTASLRKCWESVSASIEKNSPLVH